MESTAADPVVETYQNEWELNRLVDVVSGLRWRRLDWSTRPDRAPDFSVLEIGAWHGGTLKHWLARSSAVAVIDDQMRKAETWKVWAQRNGCHLDLIPGLSQDTGVVEQARALAPFDVVFVDGDHSYDAVLADWMNYAPMVAPGGVVAFHDIYPRDGYGVSDVWQTIKATEGVRYIEIGHRTILEGNEGRCGIGVVWA